MNNQASKAAQKESEKSPETKLEHMEICDINDREFKIAVLKILNEMQGNIDRKFNALRKKINEQNVYSTKEIETLKKTLEMIF